MSDNKNTNSPRPKFNSYWIYIPIVLILMYVAFGGESNSKNQISNTKFEDILLTNDVKEIKIVDRKYAQIFLKKEAIKKDDYKSYKFPRTSIPFMGEVPNFTVTIGDLRNFEDHLKLMRNQYPDLDFELNNKINENDLGDIFVTLLPIIILVAIWIYFMRRMSGGAGGGPGGQIFNIGKSRAKLFDQKTDTKVTFKDVAGLEGAKEEVQEIVDFLKHPEKYTSLGGKIPKGALLVGPPGTGKTLLAKAVAGEAKVPFFSLSGSDFVEMFVGVGASRVRDLFKQAKEKSPAIIFIDEIDAIGRARGKNNFSGSNDERENTLNQLLTEMDGFGSKDNVIVIAATNRADVLDKALMRAGRFDRQIHVELPNLTERRAIFEVHLKPLKIEGGLDVDFLAKQTPGFSGADIANMCNEAALVAARKGKKEVGKQDFLDAVDRIVGGLEKKSKIFTPEEKKTIAYHEAGHATVSWFLKFADPLVKVTIVPRGRSLGAAWYLPEESNIVRTEKFLDDICMTMGGRAAEQLIFGKISTGAQADLMSVTRKAKAMVIVYGLNEKVGNVTYYDPSGQDGFVKPYSEKTAELIDQEIKNIIETQYERALALLEEKKDKLTLVAERLLEREVIFKDDLEEIFGSGQHNEIQTASEEE